MPGAYLPASPGAKLIGTVKVDGQPAYEFTIPGAMGFDCTVWVNKADYLPLKEVAHQGRGYLRLLVVVRARRRFR